MKGDEELEPAVFLAAVANFFEVNFLQVDADFRQLKFTWTYRAARIRAELAAATCIEPLDKDEMWGWRIIHRHRYGGTSVIHLIVDPKALHSTP